MSTDFEILMQTVKQRNAEKQAEMDANPSITFMAFYPEDEAYYRDGGIGSVAQLDRHNNIATYSDAYKDIYGSRPRHIRWDELSDEEVQEKLDALWVDYDEHMAELNLREEKAVANFEATIKNLMETGAGDRETAIRWFVDGLGIDGLSFCYGGSYVCFEAGLPYRLQGEFEAYAKEKAAEYHREQELENV